MTAQMDNDVTGVNIFHNERAKLPRKKGTELGSVKISMELRKYVYLPKKMTPQILNNFK